jgi:hypothetical protein
MSRGPGVLQRRLFDLLADGRPRAVVELAAEVDSDRRGVHRAVVGLRSRGLVSTSIDRSGLVARADVVAEPTGYLARLLAEARRRGDVERAERILSAAGAAR